ncbi:MAG: redoxin domain-containing protein [Sterolibacterium sp.]|nr:redoxin domain-containing protein [Sterolibacterium sp.]
MRWLHCLCGLLWLVCSLAQADADAAVQPFVSGSLARLSAARAGHPFILTFWSIDCTHCPKELKTLAELKRQHPQVDIVLVSTDLAAPIAPLADFAAQQGLAGVEQWVFAEAQEEKLRHEIDRRWWGELPRTYFFDARHRMEGVSGLLPLGQLQRWAVNQGLSP